MNLVCQFEQVEKVLKNQTHAPAISNCLADCEEFVGQANSFEGAFWEDNAWFAILFLAECLMNVATTIPEHAEEALEKVRELLLPVPIPGIDIDVRVRRHRFLSTAGIALDRILATKCEHQGTLQQILLVKQLSPKVNLGSSEFLATQTREQKNTTLSFVRVSGETIATLPVKGEWTFLDIRRKLNVYVPPGTFVQHLVASGDRIDDTDTVDNLGLSSGECLQTIIGSVAPGVYGASNLMYYLKLYEDSRFELESTRWRNKWSGRFEQGCFKFNGEEPEHISASLDIEDGSLWLYFSHPKESIFRLRQLSADDVLFQ